VQIWRPGCSSARHRLEVVVIAIDERSIEAAGRLAP
jgi:hypothetical protein